MERQVVVFQLNDESYAVEISGVKEIVRLPEITTVPHAPSYVEGVVDLRGQVTAVMNLHRRFGLAASEVTKDTRVIVLTLGQSQFGIVVDGVTETLTIADESIDPIGNISHEIDSDYVTGVARLDEKLIILLDYHRVLGADEQAELDRLVAAEETVSV